MSSDNIWFDPLYLEDLLDEEEKSIKKTTHDYCNKYLLPIVVNDNRKHHFDKNIYKDFGSMGFLGPTINGFGSSNSSKVSYGLIAAEFESIDSSYRSAISVQSSLVIHPIYYFGSEEQKNKFLPKIASGELRLQAFGVTEPDAGTDTLSIKTKAEKKNNCYIINGQKVWTSRAEYSDLMLLLARTSNKSSEKRTEGLSLFLINIQKAKDKGLNIKPIRTMINHATTEIFFDNLEIPLNSLIGEEGKGFKYILDGMNAERILIAAECVGDSRFFIDRSTAYAKDRKVFGRPIGQNQGVQFPISRAYADTEAAALVVQRAAKLFDSNIPCGAEANIAKLLAADASWKAGESALQTFGGYGFAEEYDIERKYRETRLYQIAPVSTNLILAYIAQNILGLKRSY